MSKPPFYWSTNDDEENLNHESPHEAVKEYVQLFVHPKTLLPGATITVYGYALEVLLDVPEMIEQLAPLETMVDTLDEIYAADGHQTDICAAMKAAELEFVTKVRALYEPMLYETDASKHVVVDLHEWAKEHCTEALAEPGPHTSGLFPVAPERAPQAAE